jgi:hypothetical protein
MFADKAPPPARARSAAFSEVALIATIVVAFLLLHTLAATMLQRTPAGANAPPPQEATSLSD